MENGVSSPTIEGAAEAARRIKVKVEMDQNGPGWNYAIGADDQASGPYVKAGNKIDLGQGPGSGSVIEFRLQGKLGKRLDFKTSDPIWVKAGDCPTGKCDVPNEIQINGCSTERLTIEAFNRNAGDLHYRLNFVDDSGNDLSWDPIIKNGGGGP